MKTKKITIDWDDEKSIKQAEIQKLKLENAGWTLAAESAESVLNIAELIYTKE